jgi:hypothetical protein
MIQTPVGARCRACARLKRPPMYEVGTTALLRAGGVSLGGGAVAGAIWGILLPNLNVFGFFALIIAFLVGTPAGYGFADLIDRVSHKRGPVIQGIAVAGLVLAWLVHAAIGGQFQNDIFGIVFIVVACLAAAGRLR